MEKEKITSVEAYIQSFPEDKRQLLEKIRCAIKSVATEAEECISYQIPTYKQHGVLLSFACYKKHIGLYPTPAGIEKFKSELSEYKTAKGSVQFPLDQPIPFDLIRNITKFRLMLC